MQTIPLYRYNRPDGGVTVSTVKPDVDYTELFRIVADEGYTLTDGTNCTSCTDTDDPFLWSEVEDTENAAETITDDKSKAYDILTGVIE